jgi:4-hydroxy-3-methylbut-2-enyl diphosphate reductase
MNGTSCGHRHSKLYFHQYHLYGIFHSNATVSDAVKVILANPRGFCAGVDRAIKVVEVALEQYGSPIYVRHEIVHNDHVLASLRARGAVFVEDIEDVPLGATVIFSAHGVAPAAFNEARKRNLRVVDATCPLVTKVHHEVANNAQRGRTVFIIGHRDHPEVIGTVGHYVGAGGTQVVVIEDEAQAEGVEVDGPDGFAYVTQTTLSADHTAQIVAILQRRFPGLRGPHRQDICYATLNRQHAAQTLARLCELVIVIGASHSSNSVRLREVVQAAGVPAYLVSSDENVDRRWFERKATIGITSGASAPELLVERLLTRFRIWWPELTVESIGEPERLQFRMPRELERSSLSGKAAKDRSRSAPQ